jgi:plasmid maintenance system antidote protein VapI
MAKARRSNPTNAGGIADQLRRIILDRGVTAYALGRDAGVDAGIVARFVNRERDVRLETASRLASALGLRLVEGAGARRKARPAAEG